MDFNAQQEAHNLRKLVDGLIRDVNDYKGNLASNGLKGGREAALAFTKLQEAKMWIGKVLEELGAPFPPELADKAE